MLTVTDRVREEPLVMRVLGPHTLREAHVVLLQANVVLVADIVRVSMMRAVPIRVFANKNTVTLKKPDVFLSGFSI